MARMTHGTKRALSKKATSAEKAAKLQTAGEQIKEWARPYGLLGIPIDKDAIRQILTVPGVKLAHEAVEIPLEEDEDSLSK